MTLVSDTLFKAFTEKPLMGSMLCTATHEAFIMRGVSIYISVLLHFVDLFQSGTFEERKGCYKEQIQ